METIMHCGVKWTVLSVPHLEFCEIRKEQGTHGILYVVFDSSKALGFVCQSVPALTKAIEHKIQHTLANSAIYRVTRGVAKKQIIKKVWKARSFKRYDLEEFNGFLRQFHSLFFITKNPDLYCFIPGPDECQNSERTCPEDRGPSD